MTCTNSKPGFCSNARPRLEVNKKAADGGGSPNGGGGGVSLLFPTEK